MDSDDHTGEELPLPDLTAGVAESPDVRTDETQPAEPVEGGLLDEGSVPEAPPIDGPVPGTPPADQARRQPAKRATRARTTRSRPSAAKATTETHPASTDPDETTAGSADHPELPMPEGDTEATSAPEDADIPTGDAGATEAGEKDALPDEEALADEGEQAEAAGDDPEQDVPAEDAVARDGDQDGDDGPDQTGAPPPTFGVLFQAPEPARVPRRTRTRAPQPQDDATETDPGAGSATDEDASADSGESDDGDGTRRRRRRGGRGRRRSGDEQDDAPADDSAQSPSDDSSGDDAPGEGEDSDQESQGTGRKRTRRRRRGGSASEGEDPPGTVTRVRQPRADREEATGIRGSTRLEAKRQRRREGREAGRRRTVITEAEFLARRESVERVMLVRHRDGRTQIAVLEDGVLVEHFVARDEARSASMAGNVYLGRVQNVLPSMEAAFVDIGKGRNAVLYAGEVNWDAAGLEQTKARRIENALTSGQSVLVQVTKDPIGHKGARLTSQVSLPGRFLVYVPEGSMTGISRKLPDNERTRLKKVLKDIVPADAGVIVRTAAEGASEAELTADVARLTKIWETITKKSGSANAPALLHGEPDLTVRVVRDIFNEDFTSLIVAGDDAWSTVSEYVGAVAPDLAGRLSRWTSEEDLFTHYRIDEQLAKALDRKVWLPSGGSLVIDRTEAMTVVDVNTGKFVGSGGNLEETVTKNNVEAAEEIVRQLRLRDIGGIIVIDFIDMVLESNRDLVIRRLLECLGRDRTKHQVAEVSSLGLVQMTRKRVGAGLLEVFSEPCEHCNGRGIVIHTDPVETRPGSENGGPSRQSGRNRRGRAASGPAPGGNGGAPAVGEPDAGNDGGPDKPAPTGPTPAQIAAAAYAAAIQASGHADAPAAEGVDPDPVDTQAAPDPDTPAAPAASEDAPVPEPATSAGPAGDGQPTDEPASEPDAGQTSAHEIVAAPAPVPARRRRGRVQAPAGPPRSVAALTPEGDGDLGAPGAVQ